MVAASSCTCRIVSVNCDSALPDARDFPLDCWQNKNKQTDSLPSLSLPLSRPLSCWNMQDHAHERDKIEEHETGAAHLGTSRTKLVVLVVLELLNLVNPTIHWP